MDSKDSKTNLLTELINQQGGVVSIKKAKEILGDKLYDICWNEIKDLEDWNCFCENGNNVPTHVCTSDWVVEWICDKLDSALENVGALSPRTKGLTVH